MRVRLQDIAKDLNLSTMTISRVLRGQTDVSDLTKARVLQRVQELNYRPNDSARVLRTGQAFRVGVLVPRLNDPFFADICQGLTTVFQASSYGVSMSITDGDPEREHAEAELHLSRQVDALLLIYPAGGKNLNAALRGRGVPVLTIGRRTPDQAALALGFNEAEIGRVPAAYLLARGARRIAYLRGPRTALADDRMQGFLKAHQDAGVTPHHDWAREVRSDDGDYQRGFDRTATLLRQKIHPDAVMAYTDALAAGARDAALAHGCRIPKDFQVVGSGNDKLLCSIGLGLTSVAFSGEELGIRAARFALTAMADAATAPARDLLLLPSMVTRSTTRQVESRANARKKPIGNDKESEEQHGSRE